MDEAIIPGVIIVLGLALGAFFGIQDQRVDEVKACEKAGGVAALPARSGYICVRADALVKF